MKLTAYIVLCFVSVVLGSLNVNELKADEPPPPDAINFIGEVVEIKKVYFDREKDGVKEHVSNELLVEVHDVKQGIVRKGQIVLCDHPTGQITQKGEQPNVDVPKVGNKYRIHSPSELERFTGRDCLHLSGCRVMELPKKKGPSPSQ